MYPYLSRPLESMSYNPIQIDVVTTPTSEKGSWVNINGEALPWLRRAFLESTHTDIQAYPAPSYLPISPNYGISDESGTLLPEKPVTGVPVAGLPYVCPSNSKPPRSTVRLPASGISNGDNTHSFIRVDTASDFPLALILPGTSHTPPPVESQEKREPHQKLRKNARIPQFSCDDCGAKYVQRQGLNRHHREKHEPSLCMYCGAEWGRPYEYRDHVKKNHPDVDLDTVLGKAAGSRRRSAILARHQSQQVSLPTIEHGRRGHSGIRRNPPAAVKPSTVTLPPLDMNYVPQPESTQPIMTSKSIPEGEPARTTWLALPGAPQDGYANRPSNPMMTPVTALTPTVDGYHGSPNLYLRTRGRPGAENFKAQWDI